MEKIKSLIRNIPDFPSPGIMFKDITPMLKDPEGFSLAIDGLCKNIDPSKVDLICGIESRGFIFAAAVAARMKKGFVPIRKKGKLPWETIQVKYALEYGEDVIEIHTDAFAAGRRAVLIDDLLATGGTARAACELIEKAGGTLDSVHFVIELTFLNGRSLLKDRTVNTLISY